MSQQEDGDDFYEAGRKLAAYIADSSGEDVSTATLQALIRDFLPQHEELQEALTSIVTRPDFLQISKIAGSKKGIPQRDEFLEKLKNLYSSKIISCTQRLANGMLGVNSTADASLIESEYDSDYESYDALDEEYWHDAAYAFEDDDSYEGQEDCCYQHGYASASQGLHSKGLNNASHSELLSGSHSQMPNLPIEGITALLALTPLVATSAITLSTKMIPDLQQIYLIVVYFAVVHWCFSVIAQICTRQKITARKWLAASSPIVNIKNISRTYEQDLSFHQFTMLLLTLCWLLAAPLFTFLIKAV